MNTEETPKILRRVFREYTVLLVSNRLSIGMYEDIVRPVGFGRLEITHDDQKAIGMMKRLKPDLVVAGKSLGVFSGAQLLSASREDKTLQKIPFMILGDKDDLKPGALADKINKTSKARFFSLPMGQERFNEKVVEFLDQFIDPDQEEAYELFAEATKRARAGEPAEAAALYRQGIAKYGKNIDAFLNLGSVLAELDKFEEAEDAYFRALRLDNYSLAAYFGLAEMYERKEDFDQAIGLLHQAIGVAKMIKTSSAHVAKINFFIGEFELRLERLAGAAKSFNKAIDGNPENADLRVDIGDAYASKGYWSESEEHYEAALEIDPNLAHVFNRLGIAYRKQQKFDKALKLYANARLHHPDDEHLLFNIARTHFEADRFHDAEVLLEEALLMDPRFKEANWFVQKLREAAAILEIEKRKKKAEADPRDEELWQRGLR